MTQPNHATKPTSRRHRRQKLPGLSTPFGQIMDVSESGACIYHKGRTTVRVGQSVLPQVRHGQIELNLSARLVRIQPLGFRRLEVGVEFLDLDDNEKEGLRQLAAEASPDFSPSVWFAA